MLNNEFSDAEQIAYYPPYKCKRHIAEQQETAVGYTLPTATHLTLQDKVAYYNCKKIWQADEQEKVVASSFGNVAVKSCVHGSLKATTRAVVARNGLHQALRHEGMVNRIEEVKNYNHCNRPNDK